ncbi:MAG: hypothetical protein AABZ64_02020 [Nitrospinota bacterium]
MTPPPHPQNESEAVTFDNTYLFKWVFFAVTGFTLLAFIVSVSLAVYFDNPSPGVGKVIDRTWETFWLGFGALIGLIGGKSL